MSYFMFFICIMLVKEDIFIDGNVMVSSRMEPNSIDLQLNCILNNPNKTAPQAWFDANNNIVVTDCSVPPEYNYITIDSCTGPTRTIIVNDAKKDRDDGTWKCFHDGNNGEVVVDTPVATTVELDDKYICKSEGCFYPNGYVTWWMDDEPFGAPIEVNTSCSQTNTLFEFTESSPNFIDEGATIECRFALNNVQGELRSAQRTWELNIGLSSATIAGIVIPICIVLLCVAVVLVMFCKRLGPFKNRGNSE